MIACSTGALLLLHAAATLYMTGLIWFVQVVHYPLLGRVVPGEFATVARGHARLTSRVVAAPMLLELTLAGVLAWQSPGALTWAGFGLVVVLWLSTWLLQVPAHQRLQTGFDAAVHRRLVATNWIRTAAWSVRSVIAMMLLGG